MKSDDKKTEIEVDMGGGRVMRGHPKAFNAYLAARGAARERNRRWPHRSGGSVDTRAAMATLARLFPTLRGADGIDPFDVETSAAIVVTPRSTSSLVSAPST